MSEHTYRECPECDRKHLSTEDICDTCQLAEVKTERDELRKVMKRVETFFSNGIELGYIFPPQPGTPEEETVNQVYRVLRRGEL